MAIRQILTEDDPTLHKVSRPVSDFDHRLHTLLDDMRETLEDAEGAGLSAPQVGVLRRAVIIVNVDKKRFSYGEDTIELINPEILDQAGKEEDYEGCLSIPGKRGIVARPKVLRVRAQDRHGKWFTMDLQNILARAFCHEVDHLDGLLYTRLTSKLETMYNTTSD